MLEPQGQCNCQGCGGLIWQSTYSARYMAQRKDPHLFDAIVPLDIAPGYGELPFSVPWQLVRFPKQDLDCPD